MASNYLAKFTRKNHINVFSIILFLILKTRNKLPLWNCPENIKWTIKDSLIIFSRRKKIWRGEHLRSTMFQLVNILAKTLSQNLQPQLIITITNVQWINFYGSPVFCGRNISHQCYRVLLIRRICFPYVGIWVFFIT